MKKPVSMIAILLLSSGVLFPAEFTCSYAQQSLALRPPHNLLAAAAQRDSGDGASPTMHAVPADRNAGPLIVIGFVGGFVKHDDPRHPEVQLAAELRRRYGSRVYAQVFENHQRETAHRQVLQWLDLDGNGTLTAAEKRQARIIIYGHSWGASEAVALARELGHRNIPVLLTIQVDSIAKPGKDDRVIPANVANAVNFYQPDGLFHGRPEIQAADPARTRIIGNFRMTYSGRPAASISTSYTSSWIARLFMKSHIQIEDDPRIWQRAAALIAEQLAQSGSIASAPGISTVAP